MKKRFMILMALMVAVFGSALYGNRHSPKSTYVVCKNGGIVTWKGLTLDTVKFGGPCEFTGNTGGHYKCDTCLDGLRYW